MDIVSSKEYFGKYHYRHIGIHDIYSAENWTAATVLIEYTGELQAAQQTRGSRVILLP